jgi:nucleotide-binding universal stress UspA family protein
MIDVAESSDVVGTIVGKARDYDLTILGSAREGFFRKLVAGTIPERIAERIPGRLLLVKHRRSVIQSKILDTIDFFRDTSGTGIS